MKQEQIQIMLYYVNVDTLAFGCKPTGKVHSTLISKT